MPELRIPRRWAAIMSAVALAAGTSGLLMGAAAAPAGGQFPPAAVTGFGGALGGPAVAHPDLTANTPAGCNRPVGPGHARCLSIVRTPPDHKVTADASGPPSTALSPADIQSAYNLPSATAGTGRTVAIVDAGDDPTAEADLAVFRAQYGLPPCTTANGCFQKVSQSGQQGQPGQQGIYPPVIPGWPVEEALDLDAVSAACPNCHILLVEANSTSVGDLGSAVNEAASLGAIAVSNSYGLADISGHGIEDPGQTSNDHYYDHPGVAVTASAGDGGYGASWPSSSPYVTSAGGTTLTKDTSVARGWNETVWGNGTEGRSGDGTGSGCSAYEPQPSWQAGVVQNCAMRATADVSADANPASGLAIYDTTGAGGWLQVGGTSLSSPLIAATYALAGAPAAGTYPSSYLYANYRSDPALFNDITQGSDGDCGNALCNAGPGWDGPTGLGTPHGVSGLDHSQLGAITGKVTDAATGQPVAGAQVSAPGMSATTGSDGSYTLAALRAGSVTVTASDYGYQTATATVTVTANQTATQNFQLTGTPHQTVSGTVTAATGTPWPLYAQVSWSDGNGHGGATYTTPATGKYSLSLLANGSYTLTVTPQYPGYQPATQKITVGTSGVTQNLSLGVDQLACTALGFHPLLSGNTETFTGTTAPKRWSVTSTNLGYPGYASRPGWAFSNPGQRANNTGGSGNFAIVDSDYDGARHYQDTYLTSPAVNMTAGKTPIVQFASNLQPAVNSTATVQVSTDGGRSWDTVWKNTGFPGDPGPATKLVALPQAAGKPDVRVRFGYLGEWSQYWQIDNVFIGEHTCTQQTGGLAVGRVADASGNAVNGATVTSAANPAEKTVTVATPGDTAVNGGLYALFVTETGSQQFTASATGYTTATQSATINAGQVSALNFALTTASGTGTGRAGPRPGGSRR